MKENKVSQYQNCNMNWNYKKKKLSTVHDTKNDEHREDLKKTATQLMKENNVQL